MHHPLPFSTHSHVFYKHGSRTRLILLVAQTLRLILKDGSDVYLLLSNSRFTSERPGERSSPARGAVSLSCFERPPQAARGTADHRIPAHASDFIHRESDQQPFQQQGDHLLSYSLFSYVVSWQKQLLEVIKCPLTEFLVVLKRSLYTLD